MSQFMRPTQDLDNEWLTSDMWMEIDETSYNDTDYGETIEHEFPFSELVKFQMSSLTSVISGTCTIRCRGKADLSVAGMRFYVYVYEGTTLRQGVSWIPETSFTTHEQTFLSSSITDWSNINVVIVAESTVEEMNKFYCSWLEIETPNAGGSTYNESITLSGNASVAQSTAIDMVPSLSLPGNASITEETQHVMESSLSLSGNAAIDQSGLLVMDGSIDLSSNASIAESGVLELFEGITLSAIGDLILINDVVLECSILLSADGSIVFVGGSDLYHSIDLSANGELSTDVQKELNETIVLSVAGDISVNTLLDALNSVNLDASASFEPGNNAILESVLSLAASGQLAIIGTLPTDFAETIELIGYISKNKLFIKYVTINKSIIGSITKTKKKDLTI